MATTFTTVHLQEEDASMMDARHSGDHLWINITPDVALGLTRDVDVAARLLASLQAAVNKAMALNAQRASCVEPLTEGEGDVGRTLHG